LGVILWQRVRAVKLWGSTPRAQRPKLFSGLSSAWPERLALVAAQAPSIAGAVNVLTEVVTKPGSVEVAGLVQASHEVASWAEEHGRIETALQYAEAAAIADQDNPAAAALAGQLCTRVAAIDRATVWLYRSMELARRGKDREWQIRSRLRLGAHLFQLAEYAPAKRLFQSAYNIALRTGRRVLAAQAQHDLLTLASDRGTYAEGEMHAWEALRLYPVSNPRVAPLAHDYAFLLTKHHYFAPALTILEAALPLVRQPQERITVLATLARTAASRGNRDRFEEAREEVLQIAKASEERAAAAFVRLAEGLLSFGEWEQAGKMARNAVEIATRRKEVEPRGLAEALLEECTQRRAPESDKGVPEGSRIEILARKFLSRLRKQQRSAPAK
jgi:tetratricopeptide (TPR) repeat protein